MSILGAERKNEYAPAHSVSFNMPPTSAFHLWDHPNTQYPIPNTQYPTPNPYSSFHIGSLPGVWGTPAASNSFSNLGMSCKTRARKRASSGANSSAATL